MNSPRIERMKKSNLSEGPCAVIQILTTNDHCTIHQTSTGPFFNITLCCNVLWIIQLFILLHIHVLFLQISYRQSTIIHTRTYSLHNHIILKWKCFGLSKKIQNYCRIIYRAYYFTLMHCSSFDLHHHCLSNTITHNIAKRVIHQLKD